MTTPGITDQTVQAVLQVIQQMVSNDGFALQMAQDPYGTLAAQGVDPGALGGVDMTQVVAEACQAPGFPPEAAEALQYYSSSGGGYGGGSGGYSQPAPHPNPADHVVQQLQYVNYVTHENNTTVQQTIIDQSTNFDVNGDFHNSGTIDIDNASASGAGAVAGGEGDVNAATGEGAQVIDDSQVGQNQNNSDGSAQVGDGNSAPVVLGANSGIINDDGNVEDNVLGNNNQVANTDGPQSGIINFGDGAENQNLQNVTATDSNFGDGDNISNNNLQDGGAIGTGSGNTTGGGNDTTNTTTTNTTTNTSTNTNTTNNEQNTVHAEDSIVNTEQGPGDQQTQNENDADFDFEREPARLTEIAHHEEAAPAEEQHQESDPVE